MDIAITLGSLLLLLVLTKLGVNFRYRMLTNDQLQGVIRLQQLIELVGRVQQYRCGVMTSVTKQGRILEISRQINQLRENLHDDMTFCRNERWLGFLDHWSRLKDKTHLQSAEPTRVLKQFDAMASNLLQLVEEQAESDKLNKQYLTDFPNITLLWREFPLIIENAHKLILLNDPNNPGAKEENNSKKKIMLLKLVLQLSRACLHYVRYNGSPNQRREVLLSMAAKFSQHLQHDLESGNLNQTAPPVAFQQMFTDHLKEFVHAFQRLQNWEMDNLKNQVSDSHRGIVSV